MSADDHADLDRRGQAAAADLRAVAAQRPVPVWNPESAAAPAPTPVRPRRHRMLAVAAVVVALAAVAAVVATRGDGDDTTTDPVSTGQLRGWELPELPQGLELQGAGEDRVDPAQVAGTPLAVYGPADDDPRVGVSGMDGWSIAQVGDSVGERFTVDGVEAIDMAKAGLAPAAVLIDDPDAPGDGILAVAPEGTRDELGRLAIATTVADGKARVDPAAVPAGWSLRFDEPGGALAGTPNALARGGMTDARSTAYFEGNPGDVDVRTLTVTARLGDHRQLDVLRLTSTEVEEVDVAGQPGVLATTDLLGGLGTSWTAAWQPTPGEVLYVTGWNLSRAEVLAAAAAARPLAEEAWDELVARSELGLLGPGDGSSGPVVAQGAFPDGTDFALRVGAESGPNLSVAVDGASDSSSSAFSSFGAGGSPEGPLWAGSTSEVGGRRFLAVLVDPEVTTGVLVADGEEVGRTQSGIVGATGDPDDDQTLREELGELADARWLVAEVPPGTEELVLLDEDGTELARHSIGELGIDPDGPDPGGTETTVVDPSPPPTTTASGSSSSSSSSGSGS